MIQNISLRYEQTFNKKARNMEKETVNCFHFFTPHAVAQLLLTRHIPVTEDCGAPDYFTKV